MRGQVSISKLIKHKADFCSVISEAIKLAMRHSDHLDHLLGSVKLYGVRPKTFKSAKGFVFFDPLRKGFGCWLNPILLSQNSARLFKSKTQIIIAHTFNDCFKREPFALDRFGRKGFATFRIFANIELGDAVLPLPHSPFDEIFGKAKWTKIRKQW
jgi:hypothetical protein